MKAVIAHAEKFYNSLPKSVKIAGLGVAGAISALRVFSAINAAKGKKD